MSPRDFDEIVQEQQTLCAEARAMTKAMPKSLAPPFPPLETTGFVSFSLQPRFETSFVSGVNSSADNYRTHQKTYAEFARSAAKAESDDALTIFGPLVLCFALALRITKVTGELVNARSKTGKGEAKPTDRQHKPSDSAAGLPVVPTEFGETSGAIHSNGNNETANVAGEPKSEAAVEPNGTG
jgi:hypothetical protein